MTDSGASLEVTPTQTVPLPPSTPEVQAIPAAGLTPAQVQTMIANPPPPPLTPVQPVPQEVPSAAPPPPPTVTVERTLAGVEQAAYRPVGVVTNWRTLVGMIKLNLPRTSNSVSALADSLIGVFK